MGFACVMVFISVSWAADEKNRHRSLPCILKRVRRAARDKDCVSGSHFVSFAPDGHSSCALQYVIDLFGFQMMMASDALSGGQHLFSEAASLNRRGGTVNQRANLRAVRSIDNGGVLAINDNH